MHRTATALLAVAIVTASAGCSRDEPPPAQGSAQPTAPVKNVESLPSGTIQEGAKTMNRAAGLGNSLEQQKQERDKDIESQQK
ncbi:MAG TPA: hypothetical protein VFB20_08665 [Burkholderiales bacterium]|nr:hypothetical protein [Burkholderiales bacterium]